MTLYARVFNGVVIEPPVDIPDADTPSRYFPDHLDGDWIACPPDVMDGWIYTPPNTFLAPAPVITAAMKSRSVVASGCAVVSTATPSLSGTYACDPATQAQITSEALYVQVTTSQGAGKFTNGQQTKPWPDIAGARHTFALTDFINFAEAMAQYIDAVAVWAEAGATGSAPAQPVTIA